MYFHLNYRHQITVKKVAKVGFKCAFFCIFLHRKMYFHLRNVLSNQTRLNIMEFQEIFIMYTIFLRWVGKRCLWHCDKIEGFLRINKKNWRKKKNKEKGVSKTGRQWSLWYIYIYIYHVVNITKDLFFCIFILIKYDILPINYYKYLPVLKT